ncbi:DUF262 domain-containing protein [Campylobacter majalis]|uniref:DUF262 domain-containing protein n=1 Tax=Campylobacter majalis TaxID=2790656 RepID=UPI003D68BD59
MSENLIEKLNIDRLNGRKFKIPLYQREYAWGANEVQTLLNDLKNATEPYYIGNIVIDSEGNIIDGQQRLTTLYLMLMVSEHKNIFELSYEIRQEDNEFLQLKNPNAECKNDNMYENLKVIKKYKEESEKNQQNDTTKQSLKDILDKVSLTLITLPPDTDITRYFELINSRGVQLEKHQILKAKFLEKLKNNTDYDWAKIWEYCSNMNCYVEDIVSYKNSGTKIEKIRENFVNFLRGGEIPEYFKKPQNKEGETKQTIKLILDSSESKDNNKAEESINLPKEYESIMSFDYLLLNVLNFLVKKQIISLNNSNQTITMSNANLLSEFDKFNIEKNADTFMKNLLKFRLIFDYFVFKRDENKKVYFKDMNSDGILKVTEPKELSMIELLFHHTASNYNAQEWVQEVFGFVLDDNMKLKNELSLIDDLEQKDNEKAKNRKDENLDSGTATPHYWFYRLEYLLWKELKNDQGKFSSFSKNMRDSLYNNYTLSRLNSVEHIQPQSKASENGFNESIDIFGNLALLSSSRNSSLGNLEVNEKKARIENWLKGKYNPQSLKMILALNDVTQNSDWTADKAQKHGKAMKKLLGLEQNSEK